MKAAVPVLSDSLSSGLSARFARSPYFALIDRKSGKVRFVKNKFANQDLGAGKKAIGLLTKEGVQQLIAFELGLRVQQLAKKENVQLILLNKENQTLQSILNLINK